MIGNIRFRATSDPIAPDQMDKITCAVERDRVATVGARPETVTVTVTDKDAGEMMAYAVIGEDAQGVLTIYAARSWIKGLGAVALKGFFQGATVVDKPLRVHADDRARIAAYAKMMGCDLTAALPAVDANGVGQGVFHG